MSLILREACEEMMLDYALEGYYADLDITTKNLQIYTRCGRNIITIKGVRFSKLCPTASEINYAKVLLNNWLTDNEATFNTYQDGLIKLAQLKIVPLTRIFEDASFKIIVNKEYSSYVNGQHERVVVAVEGITIQHNFATWSFDAEGRLHSIIQDKPLSAPWGKRIIIDARVYAHAMKFLKEYQNRYQLRKAVAQILVELNTCSD